MTISPNTIFPFGIADSNTTFPPVFSGEGNGWRYIEALFYSEFESDTFKYELDVKPHLCRETAGRCLSIRVTKGAYPEEEIAKADCEMKEATAQ